MPKYRALIADTVAEYINRLDKGEREKIMKRLELLKENQQSAGEPRGTFRILKVGRADYR